MGFMGQVFKLWDKMGQFIKKWDLWDGWEDCILSQYRAAELSPRTQSFFKHRVYVFFRIQHLDTQVSRMSYQILVWRQYATNTCIVKLLDVVG